MVTGHAGNLDYWYDVVPPSNMARWQHFSQYTSGASSDEHHMLVIRYSGKEKVFPVPVQMVEEPDAIKSFVEGWVAQQ